MVFCINCGQQLLDGAKFCANCGKAVGASQNETTEQRKTVYEGEIHKCPNCGEILSSLSVICPSCGYEIRGNKASNSVKEFAMQLANAENDKQKITLIQSYPIPNNKEDILEFLILAATCFDPGENLTGDSVKKDVKNLIYTIENIYNQYQFELYYENDTSEEDKLIFDVLNNPRIVEIFDDKKVRKAIGTNTKGGSVFDDVVVIHRQTFLDWVKQYNKEIRDKLWK